MTVLRFPNFWLHACWFTPEMNVTNYRNFLLIYTEESRTKSQLYKLFSVYWTNVYEYVARASLHNMGWYLCIFLRTVRLTLKRYTTFCIRCSSWPVHKSRLCGVKALYHFNFFSILVAILFLTGDTTLKNIDLNVSAFVSKMCYVKILCNRICIAYSVTLFFCHVSMFRFITSLRHHLPNKKFEERQSVFYQAEWVNVNIINFCYLNFCNV